LASLQLIAERFAKSARVYRAFGIQNFRYPSKKKSCLAPNFHVVVFVRFVSW